MIDFHKMLFDAQQEASLDLIYNWDWNCGAEAVELLVEEFPFETVAKILEAANSEYIRLNRSVNEYAKITVGGLALHYQWKNVHLERRGGPLDFAYYLAAANGTWHALLRFTADPNLERTVDTCLGRAAPVSVHAVNPDAFLRDMTYAYMALA